VLILDIALIIGGLVLLVAGGEALVRAASTLAKRIGISPLVIGLVVVSAATSAPEFAVTVGAVLSGEPDLALGNVVGSNIVNVLFILGISALVLPLIIKKQLVRIDIPVMVGISLLLVVVSLDGSISAVDGIMLLAVLIGHTVLVVILGRREVRAELAGATAKPETDEARPLPLWLAGVLLIGGIALLVFGAQLMVDGAVSIATALGVSSLVIGLTVVAVGTSLLELATSLIAVRRGERDMAVGNIVGSNIFNIGMVLGLPSLLVDGGIPVAPEALALDLPLMLAAAVALLPIAFTGFVIKRWEGALFIVLYISYVTYLVLSSTQHSALEGFTTVMLWFVLPLVLLTLIAVTSHEVGVIRERRLTARVNQ